LDIQSGTMRCLSHESFRQWCFSRTCPHCQQRQSLEALPSGSMGQLPLHYWSRADLGKRSGLLGASFCRMRRLFPSQTKTGTPFCTSTWNTATMTYASSVSFPYWLLFAAYLSFLVSWPTWIFIFILLFCCIIIIDYIVICNCNCNWWLAFSPMTMSCIA